MARGGASMSRTVWLRLMVMSASAGLVAMIVRPRRRAVSPRLAGLSQWAPSIDARADGIRSRVSNGSRAEAGAVGPESPSLEEPSGIMHAPAPRPIEDPRVRIAAPPGQEAQSELTQSVMARPTPADQELRRLLRLPEMTL